MGWLRHAFAVRPEGAEHLTPREEELVERFCLAIVRRRLTAAAIAALETARPLSGLAAQGLYFFTPLLSLLASREEIDQLAAFLQRPDAVEILCRRLESLEAAAAHSKPSKDSPSSDTAEQGVRAEGALCQDDRLPKDIPQTDSP